MKYFIAINLMLFSVNSFSASLSLTPNCESRLQEILDKSVGKFYTENELDYDNLEIVAELIHFQDELYVYKVQYSNKIGYINIAKGCFDASAMFSFGAYEIEL